MSDATAQFFAQLGRHGHERLLRKTSGTIRFDLTRPGGVDHWLVTITHGQVRVSREKAAADAVIGADEQLFERMARGEVKPLPAWLRNDITAEGRFRFVLLLERLFDPPPGARHPRSVPPISREVR
ncbi:SCP2 sterol-binding domain-containing protein [Micromonospora deserti]|uniref:Sterol-binding protein n=1 Tax=Micromonospora deserti TaxID=2070366 RepID=A0A2W2DQT8_9ACTN|nr:SCP2 sterol-binding domain-containing protein [Micromonospora deserti]PZF95123.1 sterol-binding protein [Micromonospora deserti]